MTDGSQLKEWAQEMMMQWNAQDPVSQKEIDRNNKVYPIQNNRNPFIDHPEYAEYIWGNGSGLGSNNGMERLTVYPNPAEEVCYVRLPERDRMNDFELKLFNPEGVEVACCSTPDGEKIRLQTGPLSPGIYFVSMNGFASGKRYHAILIKH